MRIEIPVFITAGGVSQSQGLTHSFNYLIHDSTNFDESKILISHNYKHALDIKNRDDSDSI